MSNFNSMKSYAFNWYNDLCLKQIFTNVNLRHNAPNHSDVNSMLTSARNKPEICLQTHHTVLEMILVQGHSVHAVHRCEFLWDLKTHVTQ
jgi:hypothetical protein